MTELRDSALELAGLGWHVFPLRPRSKAPLIPKERGGHGYLDATADRTQIETWWKHCPAANIGLACAASGLIAIDIDPRHDGDDTFHELERNLGPLPATVRSLTGGLDQGVHVLLKHPGGQVKEGKDALGPGIDIKADGGYVVMPPSIHPDSGRRYEWETWPDELDVADAPRAWVRAMTNASPLQPRCVAAGRVENDDPLLEIPAREYVALLTNRSVNRNGFARCPFHKNGAERTPSLKIYPTTWACFACPPRPGAGRQHLGGDIYTLTALLAGYPLPLKGAAFLTVREWLQDHWLAHYERAMAA